MTAVVDDGERRPPTVTFTAHTSTDQTTNNSECQLDRWVCDSGASMHMTLCDEGVDDFSECANDVVNIATGQSLKVQGYRKLDLIFYVGRERSKGDFARTTCSSWTEVQYFLTEICN